MPPKSRPSARSSKKSSTLEITLDNIVKELHQSELDSDNNKALSSIKGEEIDTTSLNQNLVLISRVLNGAKDVCTAVVINQGQLLISNNSGDENYAKEYWKLLKQYIQEPFKKNFDALKELPLTNSKDILKKNSRITDRIEKLEDVGEKKIFCLADEKEIFSLLDFLERKDSLSYDAQALIAEIMQPIIDTRTITNLYVAGRLDQNLIKAINNSYYFIKGEKKGVHAEMKLLKRLEEEKILVDNIEMGISKLCCCPCHITMTLLENKNISIKTQGTHGGTYIGWKNPDLKIVTIHEIITALQELRGGGKYPKHSESTFIYTPLEEPNVLSGFNDVKEIQERITELEKKVNTVRQEKRKINKKLQEIPNLLNEINTANDRISQYEKNSIKYNSKLNILNDELKESELELKTWLDGRDPGSLKHRSLIDYTYKNKAISLIEQQISSLEEPTPPQLSEGMCTKYIEERKQQLNEEKQELNAKNESISNELPLTSELSKLNQFLEQYNNLLAIIRNPHESDTVMITEEIGSSALDFDSL